METGIRSTGASDAGAKRAFWEAVSVNLAEIMADTGHYSIDSATVCAHVSTADGKKGRLVDALLADKGYDADTIRVDLASRDIQAVIPERSNRRVKVEYDHELYKQRNQIERFFGRLKMNRAIATRHDQLAESFLSMVHIAQVKYWLKFVHAAQIVGQILTVTKIYHQLAFRASRQPLNPKLTASSAD